MDTHADGIRRHAQRQDQRCGQGEGDQTLFAHDSDPFRGAAALFGIVLSRLGNKPIVNIADDVPYLFPCHSSKPSSFK